MLDHLPELRQRLNLTDEQVARMRDIAEKSRSERDEVMKKQRDLMEKQRREIQEEMENTHRKMMDVLTGEQRKQIEEMRAEGERRGVAPAPAARARRGGGFN
jgi:Spy/CpxP family protein refolding chaperone